MGFRVWGFGFGVWGLGVGFRVWGWVWVWGLGFGVLGLGFRVEDSKYRVLDVGSRVMGGSD